MENRTTEQKPFTLCGLTALPGERKEGDLKLAGGEFRLPAAILHGKRAGKTVLITAGVHSGEYVGIQAAIELAEKLKTEKIAGTVVLVKAVNRPAFEQRLGSLVASDGKNLNRVFPGNEQGTEAERLAQAMVRELFCRADYYIDLHSGDDYEKLAPYVYYAGKADPEVTEVSRKMAQQVDVPYMVRSDVASGGAYNYAASRGIPSILLEREEWETGAGRKSGPCGEMCGISCVSWAYTRAERTTGRIIPWTWWMSAISRPPTEGSGIRPKSREI